MILAISPNLFYATYSSSGQHIWKELTLLVYTEESYQYFTKLVIILLLVKRYDEIIFQGLKIYILQNA